MKAIEVPVLFPLPQEENGLDEELEYESTPTMVTFFLSASCSFAINGVGDKNDKSVLRFFDDGITSYLIDLNYEILRTYLEGC